MITRKLTGRLRYRTHGRWWYDRPLVVVQVEVHAKGFQVESTYTRDVDETYWRDATVGDVTEFTGGNNNGS